MKLYSLESIIKIMYRVSEAAKKLKLHPTHVRWLLRRNRIEGKKWGRDWMVLNLDYQRKREPKGGKK